MVDLTQHIAKKAEAIAKISISMDKPIEMFSKLLELFPMEESGDSEWQPDEMPDDYFRVYGIRLALIRLRDLTKDDLLSMSDLELSSAVRFIFETSLWVSFLTGPEGNGRQYFAQYLKESKRHVQKEIKHLEYERKNLLAAQAGLDERLRTLCESASAAKQNELTNGGQDEVVRNAVLAFEGRFSVFTDFVRDGKFAAMAAKITNEHIPQQEQELARVTARLDALKKNGINVERITTGDLAGKQKMVPEYNWLFSHTSRKVHGEPFSISTRFYELSSQERFVYLSYIVFKLIEVHKMADVVFTKRVAPQST